MACVAFKHLVSTLISLSLSLLSLPEDIFFFIFREGEREREKHRCQRKESTCCFPYVPGAGIIHTHTWMKDRTCSPGMCPDQELNPQFFGYGKTFQSTAPHQPGLAFSFLALLVAFYVSVSQQYAYL